MKAVLDISGGTQHEAQRSGALQNRDRCGRYAWDDPGSGVHHFVLHRIRETPSGFCSRFGRI
jgi:hypothetical protein